MKLRSLLFAALLGSSAVWAGVASEVEVFKSATCGCCEKWVEHLRQNGFKVKAHDVSDVAAERKRLGMPEQLASCHTAKVGGYLVEGHVPAADVKRLLREKPDAIGLAAPGMPQGSPGMESPRPEKYSVLLVLRDGSTRIFANH